MLQSFTMQKIYKEYQKAQKTGETGMEPLSDLLLPPPSFIQQEQNYKRDRELSMDEKKYLLSAERGDIAGVKYYLEEAANLEKFNMNAVDPLGRSALYIAIEYENIEMIELLLGYHVDVGEALLHAINEEFVEAVEILLHYQDHGGNLSEAHSQSDKKDAKNENLINSNIRASCKRPLISVAARMLNQELEDVEKAEKEVQDPVTNLASKSFTPDITPLILAAHKDNYEIIKILLDRGESIYEPHDVRCSCQDCMKSRSEDSLRYSKSRINAYKALASPSLISLSSKDPILTAFQLSWELKRLSRIENEFKAEYEKLSQQCQEYASALLNETRTSHELEIVLNHDHENPPALFEHEQEKNNLNRLKLAIKYKQKKFVAHPHCQQLLVSLWYDGISGYRRLNIVVKILVIFVISLMFPLFSIVYMIMPHSRLGKIIRQPFIKFVSHSASYVCFLFLLILASLRIKVISGLDNEDNNKEKRGPEPTSIEWMIFCYVASFVWSEIKQLYNEGLIEYLHDWWNLLDFITNTLYITTIVLKIISYMIVQNEMVTNQQTYKLNREKWDPWDPTLISEGIFACANVFSSLKLVYMFTINPYLGPLQISLGRMVFDIMKFTVLILLVIFSFSCGLNQLYWYYAQMRDNDCKELRDAEEKDECILKVKYFSNLFEALQTLYWGVFGYIEKDRLDSLYRKHTFTMFIGLLMFGVYCAIMIIVLINMLIAMMSNSYQIIANQADEEWKFARSRLWISYFEEGGTLPAPFSLVPSPKSIYYFLRFFYKKVFCLKKSLRKQQRWLSIRKVVKKISEREYKYSTVIKELVKRYIMRKQQRDLNAGVTEDDLNEIKQDISSLRFELLEIFKSNQFKVDVKQNPSKRKRGKLNLEKAMAKNMFEEPIGSNGKGKVLNIFAAATEITSHKGSKKSNKSSGSFKENASKPSEQLILNEESNRANNAPSMLKIAQKLKRLTDLKAKKTLSETMLLGKLKKTEEMATTMTMTTMMKDGERKLPCESEELIIEDLSSQDSPKTNSSNAIVEKVHHHHVEFNLSEVKNEIFSDQQLSPPPSQPSLEPDNEGDIDSFTERITEV